MFSRKQKAAGVAYPLVTCLVTATLFFVSTAIYLDDADSLDGMASPFFVPMAIAMAAMVFFWSLAISAQGWANTLNRFMYVLSSVFGVFVAAGWFLGVGGDGSTLVVSIMGAAVAATVILAVAATHLAFWQPLRAADSQFQANE